MGWGWGWGCCWGWRRDRRHGKGKKAGAGAGAGVTRDKSCDAHVPDEDCYLGETVGRNILVYTLVINLGVVPL